MSPLAPKRTPLSRQNNPFSYRSREPDNLCAFVSPPLEGELAGLREALAEARARAGAAEARVEAAEVRAAEERQRADKAIAGFEALLSTESERADRAISAFESLAERLEAIAEARRPWWRRLVTG
jgi:hypothetical protein